MLTSVAGRVIRASLSEKIVVRPTLVAAVSRFRSPVLLSGGIRRSTISAKGIDIAPKANNSRQSTVMIQRPTNDATTAPMAKLLKTKDAARAR